MHICTVSHLEVALLCLNDALDLHDVESVGIDFEAGWWGRAMAMGAAVGTTTSIPNGLIHDN